MTRHAVGRAPGRVNLIGEHTDYNAGLCLPLSLPQHTTVRASVRDDHLVGLTSDRAEPWCGEAGEATGWAAYAAGVVWALREAGVAVPGLDLDVTSEVPVGAGLSSSAALGCAVARAVEGIVGPLDPDLLVAAAIRAENELAGAPTGGMDQTVAVHGHPGEALLLDFGSGERTRVPWHPPGLRLLVVDTRVRHALADGQYAARRTACGEAAAALGVPTLRHATDLRPLEGTPLLPRARHVVTENQRVLDFVAAVGSGAWAEAGELMTASHASLRDDYEVSCPELDLVVEASLEAGALGARMTGGGFGGSAIALVPEPGVARVRAAVSRALGGAAYLVV